jgi:hypothetical protein
LSVCRMTYTVIEAVATWLNSRQSFLPGPHMCSIGDTKTGFFNPYRCARCASFKPCRSKLIVLFVFVQQEPSSYNCMNGQPFVTLLRTISCLHFWMTIKHPLYCIWPCVALKSVPTLIMMLIARRALNGHVLDRLSIDPSAYRPDLNVEGRRSLSLRQGMRLVYTQTIIPKLAMVDVFRGIDFKMRKCAMWSITSLTVPDLSCCRLSRGLLGALSPLDFTGAMAWKRLFSELGCQTSPFQEAADCL